MGESASPFIDEGVALQERERKRERERERECMYAKSCCPRLGYKMIVGAHNTVNVKCMWEVASSSFGMADVDACHTVVAERHAGGFTIFAWYDKCWRPQHC